MTFYNVKTRRSEEIPDAQCRKVVYTIKGGKRYAFRGRATNGVQLTKFCTKADFDAATDIALVD